MIGIGIDASTTCIGWSAWNDDELIGYGKIKPTIEKLEWRERIENLASQLYDVIFKYQPNVIRVEDVPLMEKKGKLTLVQLGATQGMILTVCRLIGIKPTFVSVSTWRKNIHLFDGTQEGKERDNMKVKSIQKANEIFGIDLKCIFTKNGNYNADKSDDDIADAIWVYASSLDKYKEKKIIKVGRR